jgi:predicted small integral membrane protein
VLLQLIVIDAVCEWCVANDVLLAILAGLAAWRARRAEPQAFRRALTG